MISKSRVRFVSLLPLLTGVGFAACSSEPSESNGTASQNAATTGNTGASTTGASANTTGNPATTGGTTTAVTSAAVTTGSNSGTQNSTSGVTTTGATTTGATTTGAVTTTDGGGGATATGGTTSTETVTTTGGQTLGEGPCDIYAAADVPCAAAYSTVRILHSTHTGPLYQIRKGGPDPNTGSGGETLDIEVLPNGYADAASHEAFCGSESCTFSKLYDQSGNGNDLTVAKAG